MEKEETPTIHSNQLLTIDAFEKYKSPEERRISFNELISNGHINDAVSNIITSNPVLNLLYNNDLLFFSTEYRQKVYDDLKQNKVIDKKIRQKLATTNNISDVANASLEEFNTEYQNCSNLAKAFLNTSTQILADKGKEFGFGGLSIEAIPYFDGTTRSDSYQYATKQVRICFQNMPPPLRSSNPPSSLLAHELTHAIDDLCSNLNSCKVLFNSLHSTAPSDLSKQEKILDCVSKILDANDVNKTFEKYYLPNLKAAWFPKNRKSNKNKSEGYDWAKNWANRINDTSDSSNIFEGFDDDGKRGLQCGFVPTEFLTFSVEHIFNALQDTNTSQEFTNNYENIIISLLSQIDHEFTPEIKKAALELIKDTTQHHLVLLREHSSCSSELRASLDEASNILTRQCHSLTSQSTSLSATTHSGEEDEVDLNRKRSASLNEHDHEQRTEKKTNTDSNEPTATLATPAPSSSRKTISSIQEHIHSKDDSGVNEIVDKMRARFMAPNKSNSGNIALIRNMQTKQQRSNSI